MPKFLDTPTWYDKNGTQRGCNEVKTVYIGGSGTATLDVVCDSVDSLVPDSVYLLPKSTSGNYGFCYHSAYGPTWMPGPLTSNSIPVYNGSSLAWTQLPTLYRHSGRVYYYGDGGQVEHDISFSYVSTSSTQATSFSTYCSNLRNAGFTSANSFCLANGYYKSGSSSEYSGVISIYSVSTTQLSVRYYTSTGVISTGTLSSSTCNVSREIVTKIF